MPAKSTARRSRGAGAVASASSRNRRGARLDAQQEVGSSHVEGAFGFVVANHGGRLAAHVVVDDHRTGPEPIDRRLR